MAYTAPPTVASNDTITATLWNTYIRDNANSFGVWSTYTPVLTADTTNPSLGSVPTVVGRYAQFGKTVVWMASFITGGTGISAGSGSYHISLPVAQRGAFSNIGQGWIYNGSWYTFQIDGSTGPTRLIAASGGLVGSALGGLGGSGHALVASGMYEAA